MERIMKVGFGAWLLSACGPSEGDFVVEYTDAYCAWYLDCGDPAQLVFDGLDTIEECRALFGPDVAAQADTCKINRAAASRCLEAMDGLVCPTEEGAVLDDNLPAECTTTWKKCLGQTADGDDTGDEP